MSGAKTDDWLAAHMDNPFRDWVHDSNAFGKAACLAYNRARQTAEAGTQGDPESLVVAELALRGLVADLNAIQDKYQMIDTLRREQAWDAFKDLAQQLGATMEQANLWFDDGRRF